MSKSKAMGKKQLAPPSPINMVAVGEVVEVLSDVEILQPSKTSREMQNESKTKVTQPPVGNEMEELASKQTKEAEVMYKLRILHAASECTPFVQTGGLGDVVGALPRAQVALGHDVAVILPKYRDIPGEWISRMEYITNFYIQLGWRNQYCGLFKLKEAGVTYYFIDNEFYFGFSGVYTQGDFEGERYAFFDKAVIAAMDLMEGGVPQVVHCHDWQTGMIPYLMRTHMAWRAEFAAVRAVYTIHNLAFQGCYPWEMMRDLLDISEWDFTEDKLRYYDAVNFLKTGITYADRITTVSPTYAQEICGIEQGRGMDGLLRARQNCLTGILNGIDTQLYNPATDTALFKNFSRADMTGKAACKASLQHTLGLAERPDVPLVAMVTRLTAQKGLDLVESVWQSLMDMDIQLVALGKGEPRYESLLQWASGAYPGKVAVRLEFNQVLARRIYAGADIFLMPSRYEPCGLAQMVAMRYGTLPLVRETGGLRDTVRSYNEYTGEGTGFSFYPYNAHDMRHVLGMAVGFYHQPKVWSKIVEQAMAVDNSWDEAAKKYIELYAACR